MKKKKPIVYYAQNKALHKARAQLGLSVEELRLMAGALNLGIASISRLSLTQRAQLIDRLNALGAQVRNPQLTEYDLAEENGKVTRFPVPTAKQITILAALAARIEWREADGYLRFCHKTIKAPAPRNHREVTTLLLALRSLLKQQQDRQTVGPSDSQTVRQSDRQTVGRTD